MIVKQQYIAFLILAVLVPSIVCPPVKAGTGRKKDEKKEHKTKEEENQDLGYAKYLKEVKEALETDKEFVKRVAEMNITDHNKHMYGLEYERYLKEIFSVLEEDEEFKNKVMKDPDMKASDISQHLEFVSHGVRTKLDEIKRAEVERLRALIHLKVEQLKADGHHIPAGRGLEESLKHLLPDNEHVDLSNPHSFEIKDLDRLIKKATSDLDQLDKERKEDFKKYEMEKEHERRKKLAKMTPEERKKEEQHFEEMKKKHKDHPKLHEPGSKAQLEEVWEEEDKMDKDSFDPKTFFKMHDIDEDGHLEPDEVEALVEREVSKAYEPGHEEDDLNEKYEEINRMREDMFKRYDHDKDGLISRDEFLQMTKTKDFEEDDGWKGLDDQEVYTPEELAEFEKGLESDDEDEDEKHDEPALFEKHEGVGMVLDDKAPGGGVRSAEEQAQSHHEQPGVVHMDQAQGQAHPGQGQPAQGHPAQGQGQPAQGHPAAGQPAEQEHQAAAPVDVAHVPPGQAGDHVQQPVQVPPSHEQHAPPQHPPPRL